MPGCPVFILRLIIAIARPRGKRSEKVVGEEMARAETGGRWQFERQGYFCADAKESKPGALVFNRTVALRDTWVKIEKVQTADKK